MIKRSFWDFSSVREGAGAGCTLKIFCDIVSYIDEEKREERGK